MLNFQGFDRERALFVAGVGAQATVLAGERLPTWADESGGADGVRGAVRKRIQEALGVGPARALVLSLAIADRSELERETWALLRATGTGHLLAISGLHVGLAAFAGFWLTRVLLFLLPFCAAGRSGLNACCAGSMLVATTYGALAGFPVSTLRALVMLAVALWLIASRRSTGVLRAWMLAAIVVLAIDPFAPLTAGFWLSFAAVLALLAYFSTRGPRMRWWTTLPRAQYAVMVVMLPLAAWWFQSGSWLAFPSNLVAIPWVSFVTVPLVFAGLATVAVPAVAAEWFALAARSAEALHGFLKLMASLQAGHRWLTPDIGMVTAGLGLAGAMLLLLPRGLAGRWLGLCLLAAAVLPRAPGLSPGEYAVEVLDVGQGQSVLVRTRHHALLYDTGPGDGRAWSLYDSVIAPALAARGRPAADLAVVSHADLDHAGGIHDLVAHGGAVEVRFNRPDSAIPACRIGQSWDWDGVRFRVLHPSPWLPYLGNDSSCVISIDNGRHGTLLTGDISAVVEQRLAANFGTYDLVTVPHHGSASSSSHAFIRATQPNWAIVSAAWGNRFGFPRGEVVDRYQRHGVRLLTSADCGALRAVFPRSGPPRMDSARAERGGPWRWSGADSCVP